MWKEGQKERALGMYAQAIDKTNNGIVHLEIEKFMKAQKKEALRYAMDLIGVKRNSEAYEWMELWKRLLPDDKSVQEYFCLARVCSVRTQSELEEIVEEVRQLLDKPEDGTDKKDRTRETDVYRMALNRAWKRLGYQEELAGYRTDIIYTAEAADTELCAAEYRG